MKRKHEWMERERVMLLHLPYLDNAALPFAQVKESILVSADHHNGYVLGNVAYICMKEAF